MKWFRKSSSAPLWQDEFSVFTADERYVNRRQFSKFLTLTSFAMLAGNLWILVRSLFHRAPSYPQQAVAAAGELAVGGVKVFAYPTEEDPCILVRAGSNSYVAYSQKCTHLSCAVYYSKEVNQFECPCHRASFSVADGSVLQGPPQRPLPRVALEMKSGQLVAVGIEGEGA
jgi:nitrite reductase/ring-hydroxylating ferredoxin subunit